MEEQNGQSAALPRVESPQDAALAALCGALKRLSPTLERPDGWPSAQLQRCGEAGVFEWFLEPELGGLGWSDPEVVEGYLRLSEACLTTTFVITQRTGACRRIAHGDSAWARDHWLPGLRSGSLFATVGISHLTTSRRHLSRPVLRAEATADGFWLDGFSPWVTGAAQADCVVLGATLNDGRQILAAVPTDATGVTIPPPERLVALNASQTGRVDCERVRVESRWLLDGPVEGVMQRGGGASTGGVQTSTLGAGLAQAAIRFLGEMALQRTELSDPQRALQRESDEIQRDLLEIAAGGEGCGVERLRTRANSLVLRATQAALAAAKGAGYISGHPAGRWCQEALFFLVWSCPQPVLAANLCELAGIE